MKTNLRIYLILIIYFLAFIGVSLLKAQQMPISSEANKTPYADDYYPLKEGHKWKYIVYEVTGKGKKFYQEVTVSGTDNYKGKEYIILQQNDYRGKIRSFCIKDTTGIYWKKIGASKKITPEASSIFTPPISILIFPIKVGTEWNWEGTLKIALINKKIKMHCKVVGEEEIEVPAGKFKCIKIHIHQLRSDEVSDEYGWYAPGIGQIKYIGKELAKELVSYSLSQ